MAGALSPGPDPASPCACQTTGSLAYSPVELHGHAPTGSCAVQGAFLGWMAPATYAAGWNTDRPTQSLSSAISVCTSRSRRPPATDSDQLRQQVCPPVFARPGAQPRSMCDKSRDEFPQRPGAVQIGAGPAATSGLSIPATHRRWSSKLRNSRIHGRALYVLPNGSIGQLRCVLVSTGRAAVFCFGMRHTHSIPSLLTARSETSRSRTRSSRTVPKVVFRWTVGLRDPIPDKRTHTLVGQAIGGFAYERGIWKPSPDTRGHAGSICSTGSPETEVTAVADSYPAYPSVMQTVVWQLGEFRERRAVETLQRLADELQGKPANLVRAALKRIREGVA